MIDQNWLELTDFFYNKRIKAFFSYRHLYFNGFNDLLKFSNMCGFDPKSLAIPNQTHSINIKKISKKGYISNTDGLFTSNPLITCSIQVADCLPIFFSHNNSLFYGLVHIGWRGLVNGILSRAVKLINNNSIDTKDIQVIIGPSIQSCCFEVSEDLVNSFNRDFTNKKISGKYSVDLQGILNQRLKFHGFLSRNINIIKDCTFCEKSKYFSFRREGSQAGRMFGLIGTK